MSLPNPDYLTDELDNSFTGQTNPSVVVEDADGTTFTKKLLQWRQYDKFSHQILHDLIMAYAAVNSVAEGSALPIPATAPFNIVSFDGLLTAGQLTDPAYRVDRERVATIVTDNNGEETVTIAATGGTPVSYQDVIDAVNNQTSVTVEHIDDGANPWHQNLYVQGGTADSTGTLTILDQDLFRDLIGLVGFNSFVGVDDAGTGGSENQNGGLRGALELNKRANRPYTEQFEYWTLLDGPPLGSRDYNKIFYNNETGEWQRVHNRSIV